MDKKLVLIDGNSIINRAFYGIPMLTSQDGTHTNAVYGSGYLRRKSRDILRSLSILRHLPSGIRCMINTRVPGSRCPKS